MCVHGLLRGARAERREPRDAGYVLIRRARIVPLLALFTVAGCAELLNLDEFQPRRDPIDAGAGGSGSGGTASGGAEPASSPDAEPPGSGGAVALPDAGDAATPRTPCTNHALDLGETDVDCGGALCVPCKEGRHCRADDDCLSEECHPESPGSASKICFGGACDDHRRNGDESDVDCGEACPNKCDQGRTCRGDTDCSSGFCVDGICCGVRCAGACRTCAAGTGACRLAAEGADPGDRCPGPTNTCTAAGVCFQCANARIDGTGAAAETDVDCGGAACARCGTGKKCKVTTDCASALCESGRCVAPRCSNGVKDGAEADIDCGTVCAAVCGVGATCTTKLDCASGSCVQGRCLP